MNDQTENGMLKPGIDYHESPFLPCRGTAPSFTEYIIENHTLEEIVDIPGVMTYLVMAYLEDYDNWLKEIS